MSRIQTNTAAYGAYRNLTLTQSNMEKSIEKLSSGFRINRAADDAAGAAIANDLRSTGRSLQAAQRNASQANSVLQIADGAVSTISTILDRMKELATSAASDSSGTTGRANLDAEYQQLVAEIDRITATTKYQGSALLPEQRDQLLFLFYQCIDPGRLAVKEGGDGALLEQGWKSGREVANKGLGHALPQEWFLQNIRD